MARRCSLQLLFLNCFLIGPVICQTAHQLASIPSDPLELATGPVEVADTPDKRAAILALIERARQNNNLHSPGGAPFDLKVSFNASGPVAYTGAGEMEEVWITNRTWRWTARLGSYSQSRIFYNGVAYDSKAHAYLPLRLQMLRGAIYWPVAGNLAGGLIRIAPANWKGMPVTCALTSGMQAEASNTPGRRWYEEEFCIDPKSGLLQTYSVAPGMYSVFDYGSALQFNGRVLPRQISVVVAGMPVLQAQLDSITDPGAADESAFTPTQEMQAPGVMLRGQTRFTQFMPTPQASAAGTIQPVIIHAALDGGGKVLEAEALQTVDSGLAEAALEFVKNNVDDPSSPAGAPPIQREAFIKILFGPPPK